MGASLRGRRFWEAGMELGGGAGLDSWMKASLAWDARWVLVGVRVSEKGRRR